MINDITPMKQGQTDPSAHWTFRNYKGDALPLPTGTTFTFYIHDVASGETTTGQGSFTIVDLSTGQVDYNWHVNDTASTGAKKVFVGYLTLASAQGYTLPVDWQVDPV